MNDPLLTRIVENPFYVLGLPVTCTRQDVEREGQKLLSMLALNLSEALNYATPFGPRTRTPELVRLAMSDLREPSKRLTHELLATLAVRPNAPRPKPLNLQRASHLRWSDAQVAFSLGPKREDA